VLDDAARALPAAKPSFDAARVEVEKAKAAAVPAAA